MSVNLYSFVENPFTDKAYFNYDKFKDVVYKAQRLMDDVVDLEEEKINKILEKIENDPEPEEIKAIEKNLWLKIKEKLLNGRRTGLSAIGLSDCFAALQYQYGSNISIELAEEIYKQFAIAAYKSSIEMAKERGAFPIWDYETETENPYLNRIIEEMTQTDPLGADEFHYSQWREFGRRNIALLTEPPSGTISLLAGISSGIEPVYQLSYKRRRKLEKGNPKITFTDQNGDGWEEYNVLHPKYEVWLDLISTPETKDLIREGEGLIATSPYFKSTAYEIDPLQRVKLQSTIQKWIDHSISSTINLPKDTTEETVSNLYIEAWKQGCKGLTVYVDQSRTGVLIDNNTKTESFTYHDAPKRPTTLLAEFYKVKVQGKDYGVFVGLLENKPYEIFAFAEPKTDLKNITGSITKVKKRVYSFNSQHLTVPNLVQETEFGEEQTFTLMVSGLLRHGANPKFIMEWISKSNLEIVSFGKAISRVLKNYIKDTEKITQLCPECSSQLTYQDGCVKCTSCGYSKCG
jgi:ribonucleoside-diphosphate reductase alpha chain